MEVLSQTTDCSSDADVSTDEEINPQAQPQQHQRGTARSQQEQSGASSGQPWYCDAKYQRYWKHHRVMWQWFRHHLQAQKHVKEMRHAQTQAMYWYSGMQAHWQAYWQHYSKAYTQTRDSDQHSNTNNQHTPAPSVQSSDSFRKPYPMPPRPLPRPSRRGHGSPAQKPRLSTSKQHHKSPSTSEMSDSAESSSSSIRHHKTNSKSSRKRRHSRRRSKKRSTIIVDVETDPLSPTEQYQMEISQDMIDFFTHSAKHKKERDARKCPAVTKKADDAEKSEKKEEVQEEEEADHIPIQQAPTARKVTSLPPAVRPGVRRTTEMRQLYGHGAAMIHGMETAMQLTYDRNNDLRQPKMWPHIPLSIKFS